MNDFLFLNHLSSLDNEFLLKHLVKIQKHSRPVAEELLKFSYNLIGFIVPNPFPIRRRSNNVPKFPLGMHVHVFALFFSHSSPIAESKLRDLMKITKILGIYLDRKRNVFEIHKVEICEAF